MPPSPSRRWPPDRESSLSALTPLSKRRFGWIRSLHAKKERAASGLTLLEGERLLREAIPAGVRLELAVGTPAFWTAHPDLIHICGTAGVPTRTATERQLEQLAVTEQTAGVLAVCTRPKWQEDDIWNHVGRQPFLGLLAVGLQDPGNAGTLLRTLAAAGGAGVWFSARSVDLASPKVIRASAGAVFRLPAVGEADPAGVLDRCRQRNIPVLAAVPRRGHAYNALDLTRPVLWVLGGEGGGLEESLIGRCDDAVQIPMPGGTESLNVAAAGAVLLFETVRQRRQAAALTRRNPR